MTRRHVTFPCAGETLVGTVDGSDGPVGLLIVSGGNEPRSGAFGWQATLATEIAAKGYPVLRYDRPGAGDSSGENRGFADGRPHIAQAQDAFFAACPSLGRIIGFGNCDAASALMLQSGASCDALVLANPWIFDGDEGDQMPPEAIRARYLGKLTNARERGRLLRGGVSLKKLLAGLRRAATPSQSASGLFQKMREGLTNYDGDCRIVIAGRDRTGQAFRNAWGEDRRIAVCEGADHAFSAAQDREWLTNQLLSALEKQARQLDMR